MNHPPSLSLDGRLVFVLGRDTPRKGEFCKTEYDKLLGVDAISGKILHAWSFYDHRKELLKLTGPLQIALPIYDIKKEQLKMQDECGSEECLPVCEVTHSNSIYEIPSNPTGATNPAFKQGNLIVSLHPYGIAIILDREMKHILWHKKLNDGGVHDIQVLGSGRVLYYSNCVGGHLSIETYDPLADRVDWRFPEARTTQLGCAGIMGGAQLLGSQLLFNINDDQHGGISYLADRDGKLEWSFPNPMRMNPYFSPKGNPPFFQHLKRYDLTHFLEKNRL